MEVHVALEDERGEVDGGRVTAEQGGARERTGRMRLTKVQAWTLALAQAHAHKHMHTHMHTAHDCTRHRPPTTEWSSSATAMWWQLGLKDTAVGG